MTVVTRARVRGSSPQMSISRGWLASSSSTTSLEVQMTEWVMRSAFSLRWAPTSMSTAQASLPFISGVMPSRGKLSAIRRSPNSSLLSSTQTLARRLRTLMSLR
ncbi:hypothetical protein D3C86_1945850 [compost metagenome]